MTDDSSEAATVNSVPAGWHRDKVARLCDGVGSGGTPDSHNPDFYGGGIPWVQTGDLGDTWLRETSKTITEEGMRGSSARLYPESTLLIAMYGATIGKLGILEVPATVNQACCALQLRTVFDVRFMFYKLLSIRSDFIAAARGGGQQNINQEAVKQTYITYPPLPEQTRAAAYLDASCAVIDAAMDAKRRQFETLDRLLLSTIQQAVTRGLDDGPKLRLTNNVWIAEIPEGWQLISLKRLCEIHTGLTLGKTYTGLLIKRPYLRVANVQAGHLDLSDVTLIEVPESVAHGVELRAGDVLMTEGGDLDKLGRGTIWNGEIPGCLHQNHIFAVRCFRHKLSPAFLAYLTASQYGRDYFEATGKRTTNLASTNSTKVGLFPIPLPTIKVQEAICSFLDDKLAEIKRLQSGIETQIATLVAYRKSLIHECVTGQRRISEADVRRVCQGLGSDQEYFAEASV